MTIEEKINLVKQVGEEIITESELQALFENGKPIIAYDGFEPSGQIHIAQGIMRTININKMIKTGIKFKMLVADWHAFANNKMGGDLDKIQTVGRYFIEVWRACGMDLNHIEFIWASDLVKNTDYWKLVLQIAKTNSIRRFIRTAEIMGRQESFDLSAAHIIYPCMQTADIFTLGAQITQLGMDQRKVNMLAREIGSQLGFWKPIVVSHHMLAGLAKPSSTHDIIAKRDAVYGKTARTIELKMSKSKPDSAIFMTNTFEDIKRKLNKAWCPEGIVEGNPVLEYCQYMLFDCFGNLLIERPDKFGGVIKISSYTELVKLYQQKLIHPQDLKNTVALLLDKLLQPVRQHFAENKDARKLLETVKNYQVTR